MTRMVSYLLLSLSIWPSLSAYAQNTQDELSKYRQLLADNNPAELWEIRGEELWKKKAGPKQSNLSACDLGLGPGILAGAYVQLPRYFADVNKVMDLEQRLQYCRMQLQGLSREEASKQPFGAPGKPSEIEALVAYITAQSRGMKIAVSMKHAQEKQAYKIGEQIFHYRAGSHDFSCASCHAIDGQRIRMQNLPNILQTAQAQAAYSSWPAYRVSQGEVRSMQHRLSDCFRQQRFPVPDYASDSITALTMFLAHNANGGVFNAPALKR